MEPGCDVKGVVCHVAKPEHRKNLVKEVKIFKKGGNIMSALEVFGRLRVVSLLLSPLCVM